MSIISCSYPLMTVKKNYLDMSMRRDSKMESDQETKTNSLGVVPDFPQPAPGTRQRVGYSQKAVQARIQL